MDHLYVCVVLIFQVHIYLSPCTCRCNELVGCDGDEDGADSEGDAVHRHGTEGGDHDRTELNCYRTDRVELLVLGRLALVLPEDGQGHGEDNGVDEGGNTG